MNTIGNFEKELSLFDFQAKFKSEKDCLEYLAMAKWADGFTCKKCSHQHYCKGIKELVRQCSRCN